MSTIPNQHPWVFAVQANKVQENSVTIVFPKGLAILLIKKDGQIYALSNKCAHMGCGMGGGILKNYTIQCPCHDWKYDIRTGEFLDAREIKIPTFQWRLIDGELYININIEEGGRS